MNGPGYENFDGSVFKEFPMTERARLQLRAEFFNAFNTPSFAGKCSICHFIFWFPDLDEQ